ncbi:hypothetical protein [Streptomyces sp. NPDC015131]|uniref:hypothetical protein n=1 Tax=Streptomyces sp. NPDC015131 TaxID=3364941 RepID=UPI0036FB647D
MLYRLSSMAKAIVAAAAAAAGTLAVATSDGALDTGDVVTVVLSVLGALGVTYAVPNKDAG